MGVPAQCGRRGKLSRCRGATGNAAPAPSSLHQDRPQQRHYGHDVGGSPVASYRSQAARMAARSSRAMLGDLAGLPLLMNAPCSHCEQISTRGSDAAVAPICPQCGQTTRVSMNVTTAAAGAPARASRLRQQVRQLGDVGGDARPPWSPGLARLDRCSCSEVCCGNRGNSCAFLSGDAESDPSAKGNRVSRSLAYFEIGQASSSVEEAASNAI